VDWRQINTWSGRIARNGGGLSGYRMLPGQYRSMAMLGLGRWLTPAAGMFSERRRMSDRGGRWRVPRGSLCLVVSGVHYCITF
jgi:hypothetical protein